MTYHCLFEQSGTFKREINLMYGTTATDENR